MFTDAGLTDPLQHDLQELIRVAAEQSPRSQQRLPGPSEIGDPCARRRAYKMLDVAAVNTVDPLPSVDGTGFHEWVEPAVLAYNTRHNRTRFIAEQQVEVRAGLVGTADVYDIDTATVIDWKRPGAKAFRGYRTNGPGPQYRAQIHLYGLGYTRLGFPVERVAVAFIPRGGLLSGMYLWLEPYDPQRAQAALDRYDQLLCAINDLDLEHRPDHWGLIPATPDHCHWCPWWQAGSTDPSQACPGEAGTELRPNQPDNTQPIKE